MCSEPFNDFYRRELTPLTAFVCRAGFGREQATDAAQEAMANAYKVWPSLAEPKAWVRTAAYRIARTEAARLAKGAARAVAGGWAVSVHLDPDLAVSNEEHLQLVRDLAELPPRRRLVFAWHYDGFTTAEIASQLTMSPSTVRSNLRHARRAMEKIYRQRGAGDEH